MSSSPSSTTAATSPRLAPGGDLALVRLALSGDQAAIEEVLARLACVVKFVFRLNQTQGHGLPTEALEDVVQQVYAALWPRLRDYCGGAQLESWAFGFCRNCLRAEARKRATRLRLVPRSKLGDGELEDQVRDENAPSPDGVIAERERVEVLRSELDALDEFERQVVELRFFQDWSFERIARELGVAPSTVKDRCYRALSRMKDRLRKRDVQA
ncbi:MAG: sigma-70 family RNA polymerase sigma factor [Planctomycetes bacterium]|jgi:RNA polymerase sigma factor (sigma-70 family)|nr:sigma-70 family RNA polymerase sigma factor [Planctomycetota bacterium]